jgi:SSS family solute:Na+ symporter
MRFVRPEATDRQVLNVARWAAVAGGVGGVVVALMLQTVQQALDVFYALLTVSLTVPIVGGLYVRRASTVHAFSAIVAGVTTLIGFRMLLAATSRWLDPTLWGLVAAVVAFGLTLLLFPRRSSVPGS